MKKKIYPLLIIIILCLSVSSGKTEILNPYDFIPRDEFIETAKNISKDDGTIHVALNNGEHIIEGTFKSKLPPHIIADFYSGYLKSKGIKTEVSKLSYPANSGKVCPKTKKLFNSANERLFKRLIEALPMWKWSGNINGEKKNIIIFQVSIEKGMNSILKVSSFKKDTSFIKRFTPITLNQPELQNSQANLILSREVFQKNGSSALFLYSAGGTPEIAARNMKRRLERAGWKNRLKNSQSKSEQSIYMMHKNNMNALIVGTREEGETSLLITVTRLPAHE